MVPKTLLLIKQIRPRAAQIDNLGTAITILLEPGTLETVKRVTDALAAAHDTLILVVAKGAFIADAHQRGRSHVRVAHRTLAIAFVADSSDRDARLLSTLDVIGGGGGNFFFFFLFFFFF